MSSQLLIVSTPLLLSAALALTMPARTAAAPTTFPLPVMIQEVEGTFSGTWSLEGDDYQAVWSNGAIATLTVSSFTSSSVSISRTDTPQSVTAGLTAIYTGSISSEGDSITDGKVTWTWPGHAGYPATGTWTATWNSGKLLGTCPCARSYHDVLPSSAGDPTGIGAGSDGGAAPSGYPQSGGSATGNPGGGRTNRNAGGAGPASLSGDYSVDIATRNGFYENTDYTTAGQNPLFFARYYNSEGNLSGTPTLAGALGTNWRSNYDRYLQLYSSEVIAERADGQQLTFTLSGGVWKPDSDVDYSLTNSGNTWTLSDHGDTEETYSADGDAKALLTTIRLRNGYAQNLDYNSAHQLVSVTDTYSRKLTLAYGSEGTVSSVTTPDGTTITYNYAKLASGYNLVSAGYPTTPASAITYDYVNGSQAGQLSSVTDENGAAYISFEYGYFGRVTASHLGGAAYSTSYAFNSDLSSVITEPLGVVDTYVFETLQGIPKITQISRAASATTPAATETLSYDSNGYLSGFTDWNGNKTTYVNDANGDPTNIEEAVGTAAARTTTITYNPTWIHLPASVTTTGLTTSYTYDSDGNVLTKVLKDTTTGTVPYSTEGQTRTWTNTWSNYLLASTKTPNGNTTIFDYAANGALTSVTDALGHITKITKSTEGGLPETIIDPNAVTTTLSYDPRQRLTSSQVNGSGGTFTTDYTHDPTGDLTKLTLPDNSYLAYTYSQAHLLAEIEDADGNSIVNTWDDLDDLTEVTILPKGSSTPVHKHSATFDALGRKLTDVGGVGQTTTFTYDKNGNALTVKDGNGHTTTNTYDALNRLAKSVDANSGVTSLTYDAHNRPLTVTDADGHVTSYVYDGFGDQIQQTSPDSGKTVYHYDADGNLIQKLDALGIVTNQTYDKLDRVLTTNYPADTAENVTYTYDQTGTGFSFGIGRLTSVKDAAGSLTRAYDERSNLLTQKRVNGKTILTTSYTYDPASRIASITYPDGTLVSNKYNAAGYLSSVSAKPSGSTSTTTLATISHLPFGPINAVTYGNGIAETWSHDLDYRTTGITDAHSSTNLQKLAYAYDNANNLKTITDAVNAANTQTLGYDVINRLTSAVSGTGGYGDLTWTYDKAGNSLTQKLGSATTTYGYTPGTNRLASIGSVKVTTNANGNITSIPPANDSALATFAYNKANRLASVTGSPVGATFLYDWQWQRFSKTDAGSNPILFSYMQGGTLIAENDNGSVTDYVYADGRPIADLLPASKTAADHVNYILADHLGTPQLSVNSSGATVWQTAYQPLGTTGNVAASITQNLRFPGQYADTETGFSYNLNRDYMPNLGRYLETDPIGLGGGMNTYAYAGGNPLTSIDSSGTDFSQQVGSWIGNQLRDQLAQRTFNGFLYVNGAFVLPPEVFGGITDASFGALTSCSGNVWLCGLGVGVGLGELGHYGVQTAADAFYPNGCDHDLSGYAGLLDDELANHPFLENVANTASYLQNFIANQWASFTTSLANRPDPPSD